MERNNIDTVSKNMLKGENIRAAIVKYLIKDYEDLSIEEVKGLLSELLKVKDNSIDGKTTTDDIFFTARLPKSDKKVLIYIDIEPQGYHISDERLVDIAFNNSAHLINRQRNDPVNGFVGDNYEDLKKVYSIWIVTDEKNVLERSGTVTRLKMAECGDADENLFEKEDYDKMEMIFLYPEKDFSTSKEKILALISILFSVNETLNTKVDVLKSSYDISVNESEKNAMYGFLDKNDDLHKENLKKARIEAKTEGRLEHCLQVTKRLMASQNMSVTQALEISATSVAEREYVLENLN